MDIHELKTFMEQITVALGNNYVIVNSKNTYYIYNKGNSIPIVYVSLRGEDFIVEANHVYFDGFLRKYPVIDGREIKFITNPEMYKLVEFVDLINRIVSLR